MIFITAVQRGLFRSRSEQEGKRNICSKAGYQQHAMQMVGVDALKLRAEKMGRRDGSLIYRRRQAISRVSANLVGRCAHAALVVETALVTGKVIMLIRYTRGTRECLSFATTNRSNHFQIKYYVAAFASDELSGLLNHRANARTRTWITPYRANAFDLIYVWCISLRTNDIYLKFSQNYWWTATAMLVQIDCISECAHRGQTCFPTINRKSVFAHIIHLFSFGMVIKTLAFRSARSIIANRRQMQNCTAT